MLHYFNELISFAKQLNENSILLCMFLLTSLVATHLILTRHGVQVSRVTVRAKKKQREVEYLVASTWAKLLPIFLVLLCQIAFCVKDILAQFKG